MWVEIIRGVMIQGESVTAGSRLDLEPAIGGMLISMNKAVAATAPAVEPVVETVKRGRKPEPIISEED